MTGLNAPTESGQAPRTEMEHGGHVERKTPAGSRRYERGTTFLLLPGICDIVPLKTKSPDRSRGALFYVK
jgi:hypothetical protein